VSQWLDAQGQSDTVIGYSHAAYYLGMAVASFAVPVGMQRLGSAACVTIGMLLSGITLTPFPWMEQEWSWHALRFINGWAGAMCVIPLETTVSQQTQPELKTRYFAYYGVAITVGGALGFVVAPLLGAVSYSFAFFLGGAAPVLAGGIFMLGMRGALLQAERESARTPLLWRANFLCYGTAWCQGFLEGGMVAFLQLFLVWRGFGTDTAGSLMGVTTLGVILFQLPVSWLADRFGKTPILLGCYALVALCLLAIPAVSHLVALAAILFTFGACTGAMYPLGLSLLGDRVPVSGQARAFAWFLIIECVGSVAGAAIMGQARDDWGESSMFLIGFAAILLVLLLSLAMQAIQRLWLPPGETAQLL
jgi:MFS family permease